MKKIQDLIGSHPWRSLLILAVILMGGYFALVTFFPKNQTPQYQTTPAVKGTIVAAVSVSGQISSVSNYAVTTTLNGVIKNVFVKNGDSVTLGQNLLEITAQASDQQKQASAYANYLSAQNAVTAAQQAKDALQQTLLADQSKLITARLSAKGTEGWDPTDLNKQKINADVRSAELSLQDDQAKFNNADNGIAQAQASLGASWLVYQQTLPLVTSPVGGVISGLTVTSGSVISSANTTAATATGGSNSSNANKLAYIKLPGNPIITLNISEIDIAKIKQGQKATITLDALSGKTFTGKVSSIDQVGSVTSGVTSYPITVTFDDDIAGVLPNMNANVSIITATKSNVLTVPTTAVQSQNGSYTVRVLRNKQLMSVPVEVGLSDDANYEITSGLSEEAEVVTSVVSNQTSTGSTGSPFGSLRIGGFGGGQRAVTTGR